MSEIIIRQAGEGDIEAIAEIEKVCFTTPWSLAAIRHEIVENNVAIYIIAEFEGELIGYVGLWCIREEGHITNVAVLPEYRKKGVGSAIIQVMLEATEKAGIEKHTLEVRKNNEAARQLYKKFGFYEDGIRKGYYEDTGEDAVIMWRSAQ